MLTVKIQRILSFVIILLYYKLYKNQEDTYNLYLKTYGKKYAESYVTHPGFSEHQTGLAIDISRRDIGLTSNFMFTNEYLYLKNNAHRFGFINRYPMDKEIITGYLFEPWHYRFVGVDIATEIYLNNITLEEYLA